LRRIGDIKDSCSDILEAKKVLGYKPQVLLRDGLRILLKEDVGAHLIAGS